MSASALIAEAKAAWKKLKNEGAEKSKVKAARRAYKALKKEKKRGKKRSRGDDKEKPSISVSSPAKKSKAGGEGEKVFTTFEETPFSKKIISKFVKAGFKAPSPIQSRAWPLALSGNDLIAVAKTGSGKTLGFLLPMHHMIGEQDEGVVALVVAPTRELAIQIDAECKKYSLVQSLCVYGGVPISSQIAALKKEKPALIIATPGRLCDLVERSALSLRCVKFVVLDEADRMLDMGFEPAIRKIFSFVPSSDKRQTLLFSATWPKAVRKLAAQFLRDGESTCEIFVGDVNAELEANKSVSQLFIQATDDEKDEKLYHFMTGCPEGSRMIVFANTKRRVDYLQKRFWSAGFGTCSVHGDKTQAERDVALKDFTANKFPIMFATDVASRGLDIKNVTHVVNFDMARDVESYVHRIGRTGRAGATGASITFFNKDYDKECAPALAKIARKANQDVPDWLARYERTKQTKQWKLAKVDKLLSED